MSDEYRLMALAMRLPGEAEESCFAIFSEISLTN